MRLVQVCAIVFGFQLVTAVVAAILHEWTALYYVLAAVFSGWIAGLAVSFYIFERSVGTPRLVPRDRGRR